jgi:hypothetical protein
LSYCLEPIFSGHGAEAVGPPSAQACWLQFPGRWQAAAHPNARGTCGRLPQPEQPPVWHRTVLPIGRRSSLYVIAMSVWHRTVRVVKRASLSILLRILSVNRGLVWLSESTRAVGGIRCCLRPYRPIWPRYYEPDRVTAPFANAHKLVNAGVSGQRCAAFQLATRAALSSTYHMVDTGWAWIC